MESDTNLDELFRRIEQKQDDDVVRTTLQGRALSRSEDKLHLAVRTGILAIPLSSIERVIPVPAARPDIVRLVVKNPTDVRTLYQARARAQPTARQGIRGAYIGTSLGPGVSTCAYYDTPTITGDEPDQCDDEDSDCQDDDLAQ
jgi:hypothetical protein